MKFLRRMILGIINAADRCGMVEGTKTNLIYITLMKSEHHNNVEIDSHRADDVSMKMWGNFLMINVNREI